MMKQVAMGTVMPPVVRRMSGKAATGSAKERTSRKNAAFAAMTRVSGMSSRMRASTYVITKQPAPSSAPNAMSTRLVTLTVAARAHTLPELDVSLLVTTVTYLEAASETACLSKVGLTATLQWVGQEVPPYVMRLGLIGCQNSTVTHDKHAHHVLAWLTRPACPNTAASCGRTLFAEAS